jgi:hypothetical protein
MTRVNKIKKQQQPKTHHHMIPKQKNRLQILAIALVLVVIGFGVSWYAPASSRAVLESGSYQLDLSNCLNNGDRVVLSDAKTGLMLEVVPINPQEANYTTTTAYGSEVELNITIVTANGDMSSFNYTVPEAPYLHSFNVYGADLGQIAESKNYQYPTQLTVPVP